jgi:hypothetical protein
MYAPRGQAGAEQVRFGSFGMLQDVMDYWQSQE